MKKSRSKKTHKSIIILFIACLTAFGVLLFVEGPKIITKQVSGLTMEQDRFDINISWNEMECEGYDLTINCEGKLTVLNLEETSYTISNVEPDKLYKVTVSARLESGRSTRDAHAELLATKLEQTIEVNLDTFDGFSLDEFQIEAVGKGDITYSSDDKRIAKVNQFGHVTLRESGRTTINVYASGDGVYGAAMRVIAVNVYPAALDQPVIPVAKNTSKTRCRISWEPVDFATSYKILKKNAATKKYEPIMDINDGSMYFDLTRNNGRYAIKAFCELKGRKIKSPRSESVKIRGTVGKAKSYSSGKNIRVLNKSNLEVFREIHGDGNTNVPQSLSMTDDCYVVSYVNMSGTAGKLISYRKSDGECVSVDPVDGMGHANGTTYNPNTNKFYVAKTHKSYHTNSCSTYDGTTKNSTGSFKLPKVTSGIAYDESNNEYYLSKGNELYVCNNKFVVKRFIHKFVRYNHAQDIGAYNGAILVCTWVSGRTSYIDIYRATDGKYLGSYDVSIGEVESCVVDDGYLVILMNIVGTSKDYIYKTKERISIP